MDDKIVENFFYKRKNGESLYDQDTIDICKMEQNRDIIENARLGGYDKFGNYIIMPEIRQELIAIPKLIYNISHTQDPVTHKRLEIYDLKAIIPIFGDLFFKLTISQTEAVFQVIETVSREAGNYLEVYEENVDALPLGKDNEVSRGEIFIIYHIYEDEDFGKRENYLYDYNNLLIRKVYLTLLAKELNSTAQFDEKNAFNKMIEILKQGGEYGQEVLNEFVKRLKDRPEIFEIESTENYNKAVNDVLLSSLDIVTTEEDKNDPEKREIYLAVLNVRNENMEEHLNTAHAQIDEEKIIEISAKAVKEFNNGKQEKKDLSELGEIEELEELEEDDEETEDNSLDEFMVLLVNGKKVVKTVKKAIVKPILKQGKELIKKDVKEVANEASKEIIAKPLSKEEAIKKLLEKKEKQAEKSSPEKKTITRVKPAKKSVKSNSKSKSKSKSASGKKKSASVKKKSASNKSKNKSKSKSKGGKSKSKSVSNDKKASKPKSKDKAGKGKEEKKKDEKKDEKVIARALNVEEFFKKRMTEQGRPSENKDLSSKPFTPNTSNTPNNDSQEKKRLNPSEKLDETKTELIVLEPGVIKQDSSSETLETETQTRGSSSEIGDEGHKLNPTTNPINNSKEQGIGF